MEATFTRQLITSPKNRPALRPTGDYSIRQVRAVVIHWTANEAKGADAPAHQRYFNRGLRAASAHYVVDDRRIVQCLPTTEVAFHCGDKNLGKYKPFGLMVMQGYTRLTPNYFTLGLEMCVNRDGNWQLTYQHSAHLAAELLLAHGLTTNQLARHFDITGKPCPMMMIEMGDWLIFRETVWQHFCVIAQVAYPAEVQVPAGDVLNVRSGAGATHPLQHTLLPGERVLVYGITNGWANLGYGRWVNADYLKPVQPTPANV